jgi:hypothetical protein
MSTLLVYFLYFSLPYYIFIGFYTISRAFLPPERNGLSRITRTEEATYDASTEASGLRLEEVE